MIDSSRQEVSHSWRDFPPFPQPPVPPWHLPRLRAIPLPRCRTWHSRRTCRWEGSSLAGTIGVSDGSLGGVVQASLPRSPHSPSKHFLPRPHLFLSVKSVT